MPQRKLRKREIALAVGAGALAAGAAALIIEVDEDSTGRAPVAASADHLTYDVAPFSEIASVGPERIVVTRGEVFAVRSEGSPRALGQLEAVVKDGKLTIQPRERFGPRFDWSQLASATFYVTMPQLERITLTGSGQVQVDRIEAATFAGSIVGSGKLNVVSLKVDSADFSVAGSGDVTAAGSAGDTRISIGGSGSVSAAPLTTRTASISIGGSGDASLNVSEQARISLMSSGDVDISGPGTCSVSRMGSGEVHCEGGAN